MTTFLIIIGVVAGIIGLIFLGLVYAAYQRRPKFFKNGLKPLEKKLLEELANHLPAEIASLVSQQIPFFKRGCRSYFPKSYVFEITDEENNRIPPDGLFKRKDEFKLATLTFSHGASHFRAEFSTYNGKVRDVIVRPSVSYMLQATNIKPNKFKLVNDPSEHLDIAVQVEFFEPATKFTGALGEIGEFLDLKDVRKPLPEEQQQLFIRLTPAKLPPDYIELMKETNGFIVHDCSVFGFGPLERVSMEDGDYLMLAGKEGGCLCVKASKSRTVLKYFDYSDENNVKKLSSEFLTALDEFMDID